jgi:hypothetical protein
MHVSCNSVEATESRSGGGGSPWEVVGDGCDAGRTRSYEGIFSTDWTGGQAGSRSAGVVEVALDIGDVRDNTLSTAASQRATGHEK